MSAPYIPATALGGDLVRGWAGPVDLGRDGIGTLVGLCGERRADVWRSRCTTNLALSLVRLDPRRSEVAHRVSDILRARGHEVGHLLPVALGGRQGDVRVDCPYCQGIGEIGIEVGGVPDRMEPCPKCSDGYRAEPIPAADVSAVLLAASVAGVEAGRGVVRGVLSAWDNAFGVRWDRHGCAVAVGDDPLDAEFGVPPSRVGWRVQTSPGNILAKGPETGPEGRAAADAALLRLGYAYLDAAAPFGVVVPAFDLENER